MEFVLTWFRDFGRAQVSERSVESLINDFGTDFGSFFSRRPVDHVIEIVRAYILLYNVITM